MNAENVSSSVSPRLVLHNYFRSSASQRVRIALNLKGLSFEYVAVHLVKDGGQQFSQQYQALNPMRQVPTLEIFEGGQTLHIAQSVAILEYLEERFPTPALLPKTAYERARVRQLVEHVNSGIQPLQNLSVMGYVREVLKGDAQAWTRHWVSRGMQALEAELRQTAGQFAFGDQPTLADVCIAPQLGAARRFSVDLSECPALLKLEATLADHPAFVAARPDQQPDAE